MTRTQWQPIETAPSAKAVWVFLQWGSTKHERIATLLAGDPRDPRQWDYDSKQTRMNVLNKLGRTAPFGDHHTTRIIAWRELEHEHQEDPANLGEKQRTPGETQPKGFRTTLF